MRKKVGWIWIIGTVFLFIANFFTLGNQSFIAEKWAGMVSTLIGFVVCPVLLLVGIGILLLGNKK